MSEKRILIVEDELIVAEDLKRLLIKLGYAVVGVAARGDEAIEKVRATKPDLVLMDIRIQGPQDGIEVAEHIYANFDVPVSYLTAYADKPTLERAKATLPFGYTLKPFEARSLQTTVELAVYRHKMERMLSEMGGWHARALQSVSEPLVGVDRRGRVTFLNRSAEKMSGWTLNAVFGKPLEELIRTEGGAAAAAAAGREASAKLRTKDRGEVPVTYTRSSLGEDEGAAVGALLSLKGTAPATVVETRVRA